MADLDKLFYVNAGKDGSFAHSGKYYTSPADTDNLFTFLTANDVEKLVIYFHGGLVTEKSGMEAAELMKTSFASAGEKRHMVSFVWETGPIETVVQNLDDIMKLAGDNIFDEAVKFVIKLVGKKLGLSDARGGGQYLSDTTISLEKAQPAPFESLDKEIGGRGGSVTMLRDDNEEEFYARLEGEARTLIKAEASTGFKVAAAATAPAGARGGWLSVATTVARIAFNVLKRYRHKTHHDFYPTVMEEAFKKIWLDKIGGWGWGQMKQKAESMFGDNTGLSGDTLKTGTYLLKALETHYKQRIAAGKKFEIELIGHSAGSIAICYLLEAVRKNFPGLHFNTVFFLAPACRVDLFLSKGKPAIDAGLVKKFRMFTMKEINEKKDHCIPFIYTHSLLYMVSGLFEGPDEDAKIMGIYEQVNATGRYSGFQELIDVNQFIKSNTLVLSEDIVNADTGLRCNSLQHQDFDNDDYTLKAILYSILQP